MFLLFGKLPSFRPRFEPHHFDGLELEQLLGVLSHVLGFQVLAFYVFFDGFDTRVGEVLGQGFVVFLFFALESAAVAQAGDGA